MAPSAGDIFHRGAGAAEQRTAGCRGVGRFEVSTAYTRSTESSKQRAKTKASIVQSVGRVYSIHFVPCVCVVRRMQQHACAFAFFSGPPALKDENLVHVSSLERAAGDYPAEIYAPSGILGEYRLRPPFDSQAAALLLVDSGAALRRKVTTFRIQRAAISTELNEVAECLYATSMSD